VHPAKHVGENAGIFLPATTDASCGRQSIRRPRAVVLPWSPLRSLDAKEMPAEAQMPVTRLLRNVLGFRGRTTRRGRRTMNLALASGFFVSPLRNSDHARFFFLRWRPAQRRQLPPLALQPLFLPRYRAPSVRFDANRVRVAFGVICSALFVSGCEFSLGISQSSDELRKDFEPD